jgi:hypothetical protein
VIGTILDAKALLESEGLCVSGPHAQSLWVAATVREAGEGVKVSEDACSLIGNGERWVAVFPAEGLCTYEVPGTLPELVSLISAVYRQYRRAGGALKDAFRQVAGEPDQYAVGSSLARV